MMLENIRNLEYKTGKILDTIEKIFLDRKLNKISKNIEDEIAYLYMIGLDKIELTDINKNLILDFVTKLVNKEAELDKNVQQIISKTVDTSNQLLQYVI